MCVSFKWPNRDFPLSYKQVWALSSSFFPPNPEIIIRFSVINQNEDEQEIGGACLYLLQGLGEGALISRDD